MRAGLFDDMHLCGVFLRIKLLEEDGKAGESEDGVENRGIRRVALSAATLSTSKLFFLPSKFHFLFGLQVNKEV